jgi:hypothetical protein
VQKHVVVHRRLPQVHSSDQVYRPDQTAHQGGREEKDSGQLAARNKESGARSQEPGGKNANIFLTSLLLAPQTLRYAFS